MQLDRIETRHHRRYPETKDDHSRSECRTHPSHCAVEPHPSDSHECGLQYEKHYPTGEDPGVHPQQDGWSRVGVDEAPVNRITKPIDNNRRDQQRHALIEMLFRKPSSVRRHGHG
jgi:hypothetical protein